MRASFILTTTARVCVLLLIVGCGVRRGGGRPLNELVIDSAQAGQDYQIKVGDTLDVKVWGEQRVSGEVYVREDGKFTLALIGDVAAEGKTLKQAEADVAKKLSTFIAAPSVTLSLMQSAPTRFYLSGSFAKPGEFRSGSKITLLQAIATGGGFAPFANESALTLIRKAPNGELRYQLDYNRVIDGKEPNPELKDGDVIAVQ